MQTKKCSFLVAISVILSLGYSSFLLAENPPEKLQAPLFDNLSSFHHPISTENPFAQQFFDQGLTLFYAFESGESIRSFREAVRLDPTCAMCYWGLALALGSKNNMPMDGNEKQEAIEAIKKAQQTVDPENALEVAYIKAVSKRYASNSIVAKDISKSFTQGASLAKNTEAADYAIAMRQVVQKFPQDIDAKNLYVFALFDVNKWGFFSHDGEPKPNTLEIVKTLESVLSLDPKNIAANHYYLHVIEQSRNPEKALASADFLRDAVPGAEHLLHMSAHIYFLEGRYQDAINANQTANTAFKKYQADCIVQGFEPAVNYLYFHNLHFLWAASLAAGQSALALQTAQELVREIQLWLKKDNYLQLFLPTPYFFEARFGKRDEILKEPKPDNEFQYALGMWHYTRGLANVHLNNIQDAENAFQALQVITKQGAVEKNLGQFGLEQLNIAVEVLAASLADKQGENQLMLKHLKNAVRLQDKMDYKEPPAWYVSAREELGNAFLKTGHFSKAEKVFREDLKKHPKNGWVLFGLVKSLRGLGKKEEAEQIEKDYKEAWKGADILSPISLF